MVWAKYSWTLWDTNVGCRDWRPHLEVTHIHDKCIHVGRICSLALFGLHVCMCVCLLVFELACDV